MTNTMQNLRERWGLGTSNIARALHTNANVIRHWRNGVEPNADEVARADRLDEFCDDLSELGFEPGTFMSSLLVDGFTATGWDLYTAGRPELLLAVARYELTGQEALSAHDPEWRRTYWTSSVMFVAEDGNLSIRGKTYDEVREQVGER